MLIAQAPELSGTHPESADLALSGLGETLGADLGKTPVAALGETIDVWQFPVHDATTTAGRDQYDRWLQLLSHDELDRARRFHFAHHAADFVAHRARLRLLLGLYLEQEPGKLKFTYNAMGKPSLAPACRDQLSLGPASGVHFNLSHTEGLGLLAITRGRRVGIDLEKVNPLPPALDDSLHIARDYFSPTEWKAIEACTHPIERRAAFLRCWTRKEAFLKAVGDGLSRPLSDFTVSCAVDSAALLACNWDPAAPSHWQISSLSVDAGYIAAVCYEGTPLRLHPSLKQFTWSQNL